MRPAFEEEAALGRQRKGEGQRKLSTARPRTRRSSASQPGDFEDRVFQNPRAGPGWARRGQGQPEMGSGKVGKRRCSHTKGHLRPAPTPGGLKDEADVLKNIKF